MRHGHFLLAGSLKWSGDTRVQRMSKHGECRSTNHVILRPLSASTANRRINLRMSFIFQLRYNPQPP